MRVFVTGGNGFIGRAVVRRLVARGDRVVAVVRDPARAASLSDLGVDLVQGDLSRTAAIVDAMRGCDGGIHLAGDYRVGIAAAERPAMLDANVGATNRVLDARSVADLPRLVVVSTVSVFGDTHGRIVDERHRRDLSEGFLSHYDESKFLAHRTAEERIAAGDPVIIVMPGVTYGPGDPSAVGEQLRRATEGTLRFLAMVDTGISAAHVDDVAGGIVAAMDRGRVGEAYVIAGENTRLGDALRVAARVGGRPLPRITIPDAVVRLTARLPAPLARAAGLADDPGEVVRAGLGVTYWASSAKAATELGYVPRDLASGLRAGLGDG
jgi:dihydroflavonol-4-reductase